MLTQRQLQLLRFIQNFVRDHDVSPSFEEMRSALKLRSKSGIHRLISGLEERGYIRRLAYRARALEVVKPLPEGPVGSDLDTTPYENAIPTSSAAPSGATGPRSRRPAACGGSSLPLFGRIAAGSPIEALADTNAVIEVPGVLLGQGEHYVLQVVGDSMIEAGICDGDYAVIQRCDGCRERHHRRGDGRGPRGHAQADPAARRLDRARAGQQRLRDPHLRPAPGQDPGPAGRADAPLLSGRAARSGTSVNKAAAPAASSSRRATAALTV